MGGKEVSRGSGEDCLAGGACVQTVRTPQPRTAVHPTPRLPTHRCPPMQLSTHKSPSAMPAPTCLATIFARLTAASGLSMARRCRRKR